MATLASLRDGVGRVMRDKGLGVEFNPDQVRLALNETLKLLAINNRTTITPLPVEMTLDKESGRAATIPSDAMQILTVEL